MKNKRKNIFFTSLCLSSIAIIPLSISCSKTQNNQGQNPDNNNPQKPDNKTDEQIVKEFINQIKPKLKESKKTEKIQTLASTITTIEQVNQWFDGMPKAKNGVEVQFMSSLPDEQNTSTLTIKYQIKKGTHTEEYQFKEEGFKVIKKELNFQEFSEKNSFKIQFQVSDSLNGKPSSYFTTTGTAWSWHYKKNAQGWYEWYLMTNLNVINNAVSYAAGNTKIVNNKLQLDHKKQEAHYKTNTNTDFNANKNYFELLKYSNSEKKYQSLVNTNKLNENQGISNKDVIKKVEFITDFNNDSIDLFSKSENGKTLYNLDIALIKITMDFSNHTNWLKSEYQRPDIVSKYLSKPNEYKTKKLNIKKGISIGGHPTKTNKLVTTDISPDLKFDSTINLSSVEIVKHLKAPYFLPVNKHPNSGLAAGANGSAVYQLENSATAVQWDDIIPVGIYWVRTATDYPTSIPFIINNEGTGIIYNIFDNFVKSKI